MRIVASELAVCAAQNEFCERLRNESNYSVKAWAGFQGGQLEVTAHWINRAKYWFSYAELEGSRHWNAFGIKRPASNANLSITCEINFPLSGIDRRIAGILLVDRQKRHVIGHRGKIGGGKRGIGTTLFLENFAGDWATVDDGDGQLQIALVSELDAPDLELNVGDFVHEVVRIKSLVGEVPSRVGRPALKFEHKRVSRFQIGQRINHPEFGKGTVTNIDGDKLTIDFDLAGAKKVMEAFVLDA